MPAQLDKLQKQQWRLVRQQEQQQQHQQERQQQQKRHQRQTQQQRVKLKQNIKLTPLEQQAKQHEVTKKVEEEDEYKRQQQQQQQHIKEEKEFIYYHSQRHSYHYQRHQHQFLQHLSQQKQQQRRLQQSAKSSGDSSATENLIAKVRTRKFCNLNSKTNNVADSNTNTIASTEAIIVAITNNNTTINSNSNSNITTTTAPRTTTSITKTKVKTKKKTKTKTKTTSTSASISTRRLFAAIFTLLLSIACHYSNAQQTSAAATAPLQLVRNFQQMPQDKPQLSSNNTANTNSRNATTFTTTYKNNSNEYNNNFANNNLSNNNYNTIHHSNINSSSTSSNSNKHKTNFSETLERHYGTIENRTEHFKSLSIVDLERREDTDLQFVDSEPIFDFGMPRNITGRTGQSEAVIKCRVDMLNDKSVSWIRKRDLHILTVGTTTYTTDKRFEVSSTKDEREWLLHVKAPQVRDTGIYECQVNTEPKISMAFQLNIIEIPADAKAKIIGPTDLHFKVGSAIVLQCLVEQPTVKDIGPIYWYRGEQLITPFQQDDDEGAADSTLSFASSSSSSFLFTTAGNSAVSMPIFIDNANSYGEDTRTVQDLTNDITQEFTARIAMESQLGDTLKSRLRIANAQTTDTGNYTCQPTTASSASVMVHVINDEKPAAMQKSHATTFATPTTTALAAVCYCLTLLFASRHHMPTMMRRRCHLMDHVMPLLLIFLLLCPTLKLNMMLMLPLLIVFFFLPFVVVAIVATVAFSIPFLIVSNFAIVVFSTSIATTLFVVVVVAVMRTLSPALTLSLSPRRCLLPLSSSSS